LEVARKGLQFVVIGSQLAPFGLSSKVEKGSVYIRAGDLARTRLQYKTAKMPRWSGNTAFTLRSDLGTLLARTAMKMKPFQTYRFK
jgi:hypothetical protein